MARPVDKDLEALERLGPKAPFEEKALICAVGVAHLEYDLMALLIATGRYQKMDPKGDAQISNAEREKASLAAGKILVEHAGSISDMNLLMKNLEKFGTRHSRYLENSPEARKRAHSFWVERKEILTETLNLMQVISKTKDYPEVVADLIERVKIFNLHTFQASKPIAAVMLLLSRKIDVAKAIHAWTTGLPSPNQPKAEKTSKALVDIAPISTEHIHQELFNDVYGWRLWCFHRKFFRYWAEITVPTRLTAHKLRTLVQKVTGNDSSASEIEKYALLLGIKTL